MKAELFQTPPKEYREVPFWSWNDVLDPEELRRQIALMEEAGWGGFFMHARVGLRTPYLGEEWMACIKACVEEAKKRGLGAWLYDEDKWPSGFAGGLAVAEPENRLQYLVCQVDDKPVLLAERLIAFTAREVEGRLTDFRPAAGRPGLAGGGRFVQFYVQTAPLGDPWFNGYTYLNPLKAEAVRIFLDTTHEAYARAVGADFGGAVPGIFTDEPNYLPRQPAAGPAVPWTDELPARFRSENGYDLPPCLPALFFDTEGHHRIRYDFWRTVTGLFVENYTKQMHAWCEAHRLLFTGHFLAEDTLRGQIERIGAAMPHYPHMHLPGVDKLGRAINQGCGTILTMKQLDSVACQTGKPRALCENYGCSGQDFALAGRKWIGDWAYVLGINLNNPHLSLYSLRGARKRDYPPNLFHQQPWWPENRLIADYFARLSYALTQGRRVVEILVIHPMGSAWCLYRPGAGHELERLDEALDRLQKTLLEAQRDFHFADETLLAPGGAAEGRVMETADGPRIIVGRMAYRVAIVPPAVTLARHTVSLLAEFAARGGRILALAPTPAEIDGRPAAGSVLPSSTRPAALEVLPALLDELLPFDVRVPGRPEIWVHHRRLEGEEVYFLANTSLERGGEALIQIREEGSLEEWDPATGEIRLLPASSRNGLTEVVLDFPPAASRLLLLRKEGKPQPLPASPARRPKREKHPLHGPWRLRLCGPNALVLDTARYRSEDGEWSPPVYILEAHKAIARKGPGTPFALLFTFEAGIIPSPPIHLALESPERFAVSVNGVPIPAGDTEGWLDASLRRMEISEAVRKGANEIVLSGTFGRDTELESLYLLGDFGVAGRRLEGENRLNGQVFHGYENDFHLIALPSLIRPAGGAVDLTRCGLPFFAGRAVLECTLDLPRFKGRAFLEIRGLHAAAARIRLGGRETGTAAWPPYRVELAGVRPGRTGLEIELAGTLRNLLGPHHTAGGDGIRVGPGDFHATERWIEDYMLVPFGFDRIELVELE